MNPMLAAEYRAGLRQLLQERGEVVSVDEGARRRHPNEPEEWVSVYGGWRDREASDHVRQPTEQELQWWGEDARKTIQGCGLLIPAGAEVEEVTYSEFQGTFTENTSTVGLNAYGGPKGRETEIRCNCGRYRGLTVRWEGTLREALSVMLGLDRPKFTL